MIPSHELLSKILGVSHTLTSIYAPAEYFNSVAAYLFSKFLKFQFWCLSYHRHLNRVLIPLDDLQVDTFQEPFLPTTEYRNLALESNETYVIDEGESVQIYGQPSPSGNFLERRSKLVVYLENASAQI